MRASKVLQKCLSGSLPGMHALRERCLLRAVEALLHGRRLTLIDVARSWPGATRVRAPLKAFDHPTSGAPQLSRMPIGVGQNETPDPADMGRRVTQAATPQPQTRKRPIQQPRRFRAR